MKHLSKALVFVMLASVLLFAFSACSDSKKEPTSNFPNTQSGFKFELSEAVLDISQTFKLKEEKNGYIPGAEVNITINGNSELSYYEGSVTFTWNYDILNEEGTFEQESYETTVELDAVGSGSLKEKVEFEHRSVKNVQLSLEFEGYAIKK